MIIADVLCADRTGVVLCEVDDGVTRWTVDRRGRRSGRNPYRSRVSWLEDSHPPVVVGRNESARMNGRDDSKSSVNGHGVAAWREREKS